MHATNPFSFDGADGLASSANAPPATELPRCACLPKPFTLDELNNGLSVVPVQPIRYAA